MSVTISGGRAIRGTIIVVIALLLVAVAIGEAGNPADTITVHVVGLHSNDGMVDCALFESPDGFPDRFETAVKTTTSKIANQEATCAFVGLAPGEYAVSLFHDENSNGKLDRNFIGMPKEGVGASNDARGHMGPPKYDDARFSYEGGVRELTIHVQYLLAPL